MIRSWHWEAGILALVVAIGWVAAFDKRPTYQNLETTILNEPYLSGGALVYRWNASVVRNCRGSLRRYVLQNGDAYYLPERSLSFIPSGQWEGKSQQDIIIAVSLRDIEHNLQPGPAVYQVTQTSFCNLIQYWFGMAVEEEYPPLEFTVQRVPDL